MSRTDLHKIQSLMTATVLNKLGYNSHYPHVVAFAPSRVFGCDLVDLRLEQGLSQTQALLGYIGTDHKVGRVMLISLRQLQVESGVSFDIFQHPTIPLLYITECWLTSLRTFCAEHNISFRILANRIPTCARDGDQFLMDAAIILGFKKSELLDVNLVRTYLKVTTLSDIATADGSLLHPCTWRGMRADP